VLLKISGKIVNPDNPDLVKRYSEVVKRLVDEGTRVVVVVGGGPYARRYIDCVRRVVGGESLADIVGIEVSRINALLLACALGDLAYRPIPRSVDDVERAWSSGRVVVMGGLQPGQSTAGTAAVVAELLRIGLILYASDVDGVYDRDPRVYPDARKLDVVTVDELQHVLRQRYEAGGYELLDPVALGIVRRAGIEVVVFNGMDPENVFRALRREVGTRIVSSR